MSGAVGLQRFERRRRRFRERRRVFLDGGERFSNSRSKTRRNLTECAQDLFFPCRLRLLVGEDVAGRAVLRAQAEDVLTAERRDRSFQDGGAAGPDAHALRNVGSQSRIRRLVHQRQRSSDALVGDEAEERRLLKLHRESLSQRIVEHRIAGRVGELGEHDRVLVGQRRRSRIEDVAHHSGGRRRRRQRQRQPSARVPSRGCGSRPVSAESDPRLRRSRSVRRSAAC